MSIANYRRELTRMERQNLINKYKDLRDAHGGIFTPTMRRRLLGVKPESSRNFIEDNADFWYDVRTYVKNGIKDLEMISEVAHPKQLEEILTFHLSREVTEEMAKATPEENQKIRQRVPSLEKSLTAIFTDYKKYKKVKVPKTDVTYTQVESVEKDDSWKTILAYNVIKIGLNFFKEHDLVTSKAHQRLVDEVDDMLQNEMAHAQFLKRELRNVRFVDLDGTFYR